MSGQLFSNESASFEDYVHVVVSNGRFGREIRVHSTVSQVWPWLPAAGILMTVDGTLMALDLGTMKDRILSEYRYWGEPARGANGMVYAVTRDRTELKAIGPDGFIQWTIHGSFISSPKLDSRGFVYVAHPDGLLRLSIDGTVVERIPLSRLANTAHIVPLANGNLLVSSGSNLICLGR